jgi:MFS-type transporter involved in bile tolerance (Atg22 family)
VAFTAVLARAGFYTTAICFIIANVAYQAGLQFYDALLPEVSTEENRGKIGGIGVGVGYIGSYFAVGIGILLGTANKPFLFTAIAVAFLLLSIPASSSCASAATRARAQSTGRWCAIPPRRPSARSRKGSATRGW